MNTPSEQNAADGTATTAKQIRKSRLNDSVQPVDRFERVWDPKLAPQEGVRRVTVKDVINERFAQIRAMEVANTPLHAARGDDVLMSPQEKQS